jgi:ABC-2 type transport system ATP-binding protein
MTNYALEALDLNIRRGRRTVLRDLSFQWTAGRIVGLLGPSGCGKTTLLRAVLGVQRIFTGTLMVLGRPAGTASLRTEVGYAPQQSAVYPDLTVRENLHYFATTVRAARTDPARVIALVDLEVHADRLVGRLSGGERSRVGLAAALLGRPRLLVLDEPTVGLDPVLREQLWTLFRRLAGDGTSILVSSHVMDEAERCDGLLLMRDGSTLASGSPNELKHRTGTATINEAFLRLVGRSRDAT